MVVVVVVGVGVGVGVGVVEYMEGGEALDVVA